MKSKLLILILMVSILFCSCQSAEPAGEIAATTLPVYEFTCAITEGTGMTVTRLITENVSCLHDYSLNVRQVKAAEAAQTIVISGMGLEEFMEELLTDAPCVIDSSEGIRCLQNHEDHGDHDGHHHEDDPHIWLSPENAVVMAKNICAGLSRQYPAHQSTFEKNLDALLQKLQALASYGHDTLQGLSTRKIITFHDGFAYFASCFDLTVLEAVEEESGSEASAAELVHLIHLVQEHQLPAIFTEINGSTSAPGIISRETGTEIYSLDMAMSQRGYFESMYHNIDIIKEALQ